MKKICLVGMVLAMAFVSCNKEKEEAKPKKFTLTADMKKRIKTDAAEMIPIQEELVLTGKVIPDENNCVQIFPLVGGQVKMVDVELGDLVSTTKTLAVIKSSEIAEFEKELIAARADFDLSKKKLQVEEEMFKSNFSSERNVYEARKDFEAASAELKRLEDVFKIYTVSSQGDYIVRSPIAGFVIEKKIGPGVQIRSDLVDYILSVARLDSVFVIMNIYESDISKVRIGMDAEITVFSYPDTVFRGKINRILNILDPDSKTMEARIKIANPGFLLKPDMNCTVKLRYTQKETKIAVPTTAIIFDKNKHFLMVYKNDDNIQTKEVNVFKEINGLSYIESGINQGEKVISNNAIFIYDAIND